MIRGVCFLYTGNWPPVVVVESESMMHSNTESFLGVIDTGDLVLVKTIGSRDDVVTYAQGKADDYSTYSDYGDVIIYRKNGYGDVTPVIHRALVWLEYNQTSDNFDIPDLRGLKAGVDQGKGTAATVIRITISTFRNALREPGSSHRTERHHCGDLGSR